MKYWLMALALCTGLSPASAQRPQDFVAQLPLVVPADASLLRLPLNADVYRATRRADLGDLRIFNAAGEALPMARLPITDAERLLHGRVALAALPRVATGERSAARVSVERRSGDTRVEVDVGSEAFEAGPPWRFLADTDSFGHRVHEIRIAFFAEEQFEGRLKVETSADLTGWRTLAAGEAVLAIGRGADRIERDRIELTGRAQRYLRLSWLDAPPATMPAQLELIHKLRGDRPHRQWLTLTGSAAGKHIDYLSPGLFPVDRLRLLPAAGNDVVDARVASRPGVSQRWRYRARSLAYRLQDGAAVREGPATTLALTRDPLWRVSPERPETTGSALPQLQLGWVPEEVVFVARGAGPYLLAVGDPDLAPAWRRPERVVPGYRSAHQAVLADARIRARGDAVEPAARPISLWQPGRHWWLWAALGLGVAVLAWMARGVWRELRRK